MIALERVTLRPGATVSPSAADAGAMPASPAAVVAAPRKSWRSAQGVAAAALIAAVPLAHAASPDDRVAPPAIQIALAPEPLDNLGNLGNSDRGDSVAAFPVFSKVEGLKANPYDAMLKGESHAAGPRVAARPAHTDGSRPARPRIVRKPRAGDAGFEKVSDLKANPYD